MSAEDEPTTWFLWKVLSGATSGGLLGVLGWIFHQNARHAVLARSVEAFVDESRAAANRCEEQVKRIEVSVSKIVKHLTGTDLQ